MAAYLNTLRNWSHCLVVVAVCLLCLGCSSEPENPSSDQREEFSSGHERMVAILKSIADDTDRGHPFLNRSEAEKFESDFSEALKNGCPTPVKWGYRYETGIAQVRLGNVERGIEHLEQAYALLPQVDFRNAVRAGIVATTRSDPQAYYEASTRFHLAIAYLRLAETQNCCLRHNAESCILPIQGGGLHTRQEGSTQAIKYFRELLDNFPENATPFDVLEFRHASQWLLNIAYMTLGRYPDDVPKQYLIAPETFQSDVEFPRFKNIAPELGLDTFNLCGGAIVDDFDNDGYLDIVTSTWDTKGQMLFFRNNQDGTFSNHTEQAGLKGFFGGLNMVHADYDNDGDLDILVLRGAWLGAAGRHPNSLLQNNGKGAFTDMTFEAGLGNVDYPTKTAAWADYDNDGQLDLFIGNESNNEIEAPSQLFHNNGDGTFTDVAKKAGVSDPLFAMGVVWGDYNGDRYPDLYVSTGFSSLLSTTNLRPPPNRLYRNKGDGTFENVAPKLGVDKPWSGFPAWFWDFNNDGNLDLYASCSSGPVGVLATSIRFEQNCLYQGDGKGGFRDVAAEQNLTYPAQPMGANFGDLDNDGFLDFYLGTGNIEYSEVRPNIMFLNQQGHRFANVTMAGGFGHLQKGHGVAFADIDNDGDQDVYVQMGGAWPGDKYNDALFKNPGFGNHWITIKLEGTESNRCAIGSRIHVIVRENGQLRSIYRHVNSGGSFGGNPLRQTIGLGKADAIERIEIYWPTTNETQSVTDVSFDQAIKIVEGEAGYTTITLKTLDLPGE
jgi:tetratricopeptide (TPR) repeat protein